MEETEEMMRPSGHETPVAMVSGAARGIGLSIATRYAEVGYDVVLLDMDDAVKEAASELGERTGRATTSFVADVSAAPQLLELRDHVQQAYGRLDALINNAGGSAHTPLKFDDVTEEHYDRVMNANMRGTFLMCQVFLPILEATGGSVVNIASIAGRAGLPIVSVQYSAAKAGVIGMSQTLAAHLGPRGIRVNVVAPGFIRSGARADGIWESRDVERMLEAIPLRRRGENEDIANACLMLTSSHGSYITGAVLDVNGGYLAV